MYSTLPRILFLLASTVSGVSCADNTGTAHSGYRPSFDCTKATTVVEKHICRSKTLSELDRVLAETYTDAKRRGDKNIRQEQLSWIRKRNTCAQTGSSTVDACLKDAYRTRLAQLDDRHKVIDRDTSDLTRSQWLSTLSVADRCANSTDEKDKRFVNEIKLTEQSSLLVLACNLGAYQDTHLVFRLTQREDDVEANLLTWLTPAYDNGWSLRKQEEIGGHISLSDDRNTIEVYYRSAGSGACGHIARYKLADLKKGSPIKPIAAKGHDDCLNGKYMDEWPAIKLD